MESTLTESTVIVVSTVLTVSTTVFVDFVPQEITARANVNVKSICFIVINIMIYF